MEQRTEVFKNIMRNYPTGVTIITTLDNEHNPTGLTANSFASVSIDPLMILWCIDKRSNSYEVFKNCKRFAVNILSGNQKEECNVFASRKVKDRFSKVDWNLSDYDLPIIENAFAELECDKVDQIDAGDHLILIGKVLDLKESDHIPMLYHNRNLGPVPESINASM